MNSIRKDFERLIKRANNVPGQPRAPGVQSSVPKSPPSHLNSSQAQRWLQNQKTLSNPQRPGMFSKAVMGVGNYADKLVQNKDESVERGYFGRTRASTGLGKIPAFLIDAATAPTAYVRNNAIQGLQSFGDAGNVFWNGSDGKSENLLWRTGAAGARGLKNLWDDSSISMDGKQKKVLTQRPDADPNLWKDYGAAAGTFASGAADTSAVVGLGYGGAVNGVRNLAGAMLPDMGKRVYDYARRPIEVAQSAAETAPATNPFGEAFDPTGWSNMFQMLAPYMQGGQNYGPQYGYAYGDPYASAVDRAANNIRG